MVYHHQQQQLQKPLLNVSGVFSIGANWGQSHTQKEIINVKIDKYILKKLISKD